MRKGVVVTYGRFNPPTAGHERLVKFLRKKAKELGFQPLVLVSPRNRPIQKNPLAYSSKWVYLRKAFPQVDIHAAKSIYEELYRLAGRFDEVVLTIGADRKQQMEKMLNHIGLDNIKLFVIKRSRQDISATRMRNWAAQYRWKKFRENLPYNLRRTKTVAKKLYQEVSQSTR